MIAVQKVLTIWKSRVEASSIPLESSMFYTEGSYFLTSRSPIWQGLTIHLCSMRISRSTTMGTCCFRQSSNKMRQSHQLPLLNSIHMRLQQIWLMCSWIQILGKRRKRLHHLLVCLRAITTFNLEVRPPRVLCKKSIRRLTDLLIEDYQFKKRARTS